MPFSPLCRLSLPGALPSALAPWVLMRLYGLRGRGRLAPGCHADVVVFDEREIGCGPTYTRNDLPAGAGRLYADASGIAHVLVNGVEILRGGEATGAMPGTVLRSGRDTDTVDLTSR